MYALLFLPGRFVRLKAVIWTVCLCTKKHNAWNSCANAMTRCSLVVPKVHHHVKYTSWHLTSQAWPIGNQSENSKDSKWYIAQRRSTYDLYERRENRVKKFNWIQKQNIEIITITLIDYDTIDRFVSPIYKRILN